MSSTPTGPPAAQRRAARPRARLRRLAAGVPLGVLAAAPATLVVAPTGAAGAAGDANIRLAHLSPDTPEMDVYVVGFDGSETRALEGLGYGEVSDYAPLDAGEYTFLLRPAGAPADSDPAVTASATLEVGDAYTFAAMGPNADLQQALLTDDLAAPAGGQAKVRLIQASSTAAEVTVQVDGGPLLAQDVPFAQATGYADVASGQWTVTATSSTGAAVSRSLSLDPGTVNSLVVLEGTGGEPFDVTRVVDSTGVDASGATRGEGLGIVTATPLGGVATGAGGTSDAAPVAGADGDGGVNPVAVAVGVGVVVALAYGGTQLRKAHRPVGPDGAGGVAGPAGLPGPAGADRPSAGRHAAVPGVTRPGGAYAGAGMAGPGIATRPEADLVGVGAGDARAAGTALRMPSAVWASGPGSTGPDGPAGGAPAYGGPDHPRSPLVPPALGRQDDLRPPLVPPVPDAWAPDAWVPADAGLPGDGFVPGDGLTAGNGDLPGDGGTAGSWEAGNGSASSGRPGAAPTAPGAGGRPPGSATPPSAWPFAGDPGAGSYRDDRSSGRPRP